MTLRDKIDAPTRAASLQTLSMLLERDEEQVAAILSQLPARQIALFAIYCSRHHSLRKLSLTVAAQCDESLLREIDCTAGAELLALSRNRAIATTGATNTEKRPCALQQAA